MITTKWCLTLRRPHDTPINTRADYKKNDSVQWVFIDDVPEGQPFTNVIAYDDERQLSEYGIDWTTIVDKWIHRKLKLVYETLDWDLERLTARRVPRNCGENNGKKRCMLAMRRKIDLGCRL